MRRMRWSRMISSGWVAGTALSAMVALGAGCQSKLATERDAAVAQAHELQSKNDELKARLDERAAITTPVGPTTSEPARTSSEIIAAPKRNRPWGRPAP